MAVATVGCVWTLAICFVQLLVYTNAQFQVPKVTIQVFRPKGFRAFIEDSPKISLFAFQGKVNKAINNDDVGEISGEVTESTNGKWIFEDPSSELKIGDIINYYVFVVYDGKGYLKDQLTFTVKEYSERSEKPPGPSECRPTVTLIRGGTACAEQIIFEDNFDSLREDLWQIEQYIPDQPEFPFVSYQRPPDAPTVSITNGNLKIEPKLQQQLPGFNEDSIISGTLDLISGCTRTADTCRVTAWGASILPPIVSGRLTSKMFAFTYGTVEIRAKVPQGDWLYPEILLEPLLKKYGTLNYASGVIRIASALGNRQLRLGTEEFGNKILYGGPIMDVKCNILSKSKVSPTGRFWGDDFHVFTLRWEPDRIILKVDGTEWLNITPPPNAGLQDRFSSTCKLPRSLLSLGTPMAPFDDYFYLTLGVAAGGITEFRDDAITSGGRQKPWSNRGRKGSLNFWRDRDAWLPTWSQPALLIDYIKVTAI